MRIDRRSFLLAGAEHDLARVGGTDLDLYVWDNHTEIVRF